MNQLFKPLAIVMLAATVPFAGSVNQKNTTTADVPQPVVSKKIQVAILLDVSGSMDGLIEQAKAQLWNMVNTLGKAQCSDNSSPALELALYEYGRSDNDRGKGYVKQLSPFTNDLDHVSGILFGLKTNGGDEYCGQVIHTSIDELNWDASPENYKVIFIAGNEDFLQGSLHYTLACNKAKTKGVIVNTIYCGDFKQGIAEHWNLAGECGNGTYSNINHNAKEPDIPTPFDSELITLNTRLNKTYIGYGSMGAANTRRMEEVDKMNFSTNNQVAAKRIEVKSKAGLYNNTSWDLVDASRADSVYYTKVDRNTLPDSLKTKTPEQLKQIIQTKAAERETIQKEIGVANAKRNSYIAEQKAKAALQNNQPTLESAVEKTIREQVKRFNMVIN